MEPMDPMDPMDGIIELFAADGVDVAALLRGAADATDQSDDIAASIAAGEGKDNDAEVREDSEVGEVGDFSTLWTAVDLCGQLLCHRRT
jgi:hypothetical protein